MKLDTLNNLNIEETAYIVENNVKKENKQYLTNLGLTKDTEIKCLYKSPFNDPVAYQIKNVILAIREEDSKKIIIKRDNIGPY